MWQSAIRCPVILHFSFFTRQTAQPIIIFFSLRSLSPGEIGTLTIAVLTPFLPSRMFTSVVAFSSLSCDSSVFLSSVASTESSIPINRSAILGNGRLIPYDSPYFTVSNHANSSASSFLAVSRIRLPDLAFRVVISKNGVSLHTVSLTSLTISE